MLGIAYPRKRRDSVHTRGTLGITRGRRSQCLFICSATSAKLVPDFSHSSVRPRSLASFCFAWRPIIVRNNCSPNDFSVTALEMVVVSGSAGDVRVDWKCQLGGDGDCHRGYRRSCYYRYCCQQMYCGRRLISRSEIAFFTYGSSYRCVIRAR